MATRLLISATERGKVYIFFLVVVIRALCIRFNFGLDGEVFLDCLTGRTFPSRGQRGLATRTGVEGRLLGDSQLRNVASHLWAAASGSCGAVVAEEIFPSLPVTV